MKLKSFEIKSYRSCIHTKLDLNDKLTALVGVNGSGKSNLLKALMLLNQIGNIAKRGTYRHTDSKPNKCSFKAEFEFKRKIITAIGNIAYETDEENEDRIVDAEIKWDLSKYIDQKEPISLPLDYFSSPRYFNRERILFDQNKRFILKYNDKERKFFKQITTYIEPVLDYISDFSYYGASQFADPSKCPNFIEIEEDKVIRRFRSTTGHYKFITDLYQAFKQKNSQEYQRFLTTVNKLGIGLIDKIEFQEIPIPSSSIKVLSGGKYKKIEKTRTLIIPMFTIDNSVLSPSQLSEGTFRTLALLYYLLTDTSNLLIIEEPEVCVHHGLLNSIVALVKTQSNKKQLIISTHSDFVLDHLKPSDIIVINRSPKKGTSAQQLTNELTKNDLTVLKKYLEESGNLGEYWKETGF